MTTIESRRCWIGSALAAQDEPAPARKVDAHVAAALRSYGEQTWPHGAVRAGLPLGRLELAGLKAGECDFAPPAPWVRRYADAAGAPIVMIEAVVAVDIASAHEQLGAWLASRTDPTPAPTCKTQGVEAGEIGFVGLSRPQRIAWIAFARGNVAVRVLCLDPRVDPHPDMPGIARTIDQAILAVPPLGKATAPPRPAFERLLPDRTSCTVGDLVVLDLAVRDPAGGDPQLRFVVAGPGQGYVEADASGRQVLHTTGAGAITLCVQACGALGTVAEATTRIEVAAR